ncbi:Hsp20/alpha crystallin family protein [Natranaerofaba carboxydovora]|uniref:Hsp20/alpha crystallin family protein n=1 Tax=Natranaerofaba carboxydovora TaxID=2742683 RepID=UPI001F138147|nr:Hsp20/alpha crystallin family protein [Natranaerofaba carboxydovora]UMZ74835.1 putative Hsp20 family chaperone [Natranaerofaba carboxydovora]
MTRLPRRWGEPFGMLADFGSLLDKFDTEFGLKSNYGRTDIYEKDGELHFEIELPGLDKENLNARIEEDRLIVEGEITRDDKIEKENYLRMERSRGEFKKAFPLPNETDTDSIDNLKAKFQDGILKISVPLKKSIKGDSIDIEIE